MEDMEVCSHVQGGEGRAAGIWATGWVMRARGRRPNAGNCIPSIAIAPSHGNGIKSSDLVNTVYDYPGGPA